MGPEKEVHLGIALSDFGGDVLLLGHAAAEADEELRAAGFQVGELPHVAEDLHLGVFPDGAGVVEDQVGLGRLLGEAEAHFRQHSHEPLAVGGVLLAAVAPDQGQEGVVLPEPLRQKPGAPGGIVPLLLDLLRGEKNVGAFVDIHLLGQNGTSGNGLAPFSASTPGKGISILFYHARQKKTRAIL